MLVKKEYRSLLLQVTAVPLGNGYSTPYAENPDYGLKWLTLYC